MICPAFPFGKLWGQGIATMYFELEVTDAGKKYPIVTLASGALELKVKFSSLVPQKQ